jgi:beta-fructofuranosidase
MNRRDFLFSSAAAALHSGRLPGSALGQANAVANGNAPDSPLSADPLRPQYHLLPQAGAVGDPCAPQFHRGAYHVFFHGSYGGKGWHHAVSTDLVHWRHLPIALAPTADGYDSYGTFTGGVLPGVEGASVVYTAVTKVPRSQETIRAEGLRETQAIATSMDDDLRVWKKRDKVVIDGPPPGLEVVGFRDPFAWKDGDTWYLCVGSGFPQSGGAVLLYRSKDTVNWEYLHPLAQGIWNGQSFSNPVPSGEMWECPDFFPLGEKHVLMYSTEHTTRWEVGTFDKSTLRFHSEKKGIVDHGAYYAPRSMADGNGRRILWGWVQETRDPEVARQAGWWGSISLPRVLSLGENNSLYMEAAPELEGLRRNTVAITAPRSTEELNRSLLKATIPNRSGEVLCKFNASGAECGLELQLQSRDGSRKILALACSQANRAPFVGVGDKLLPLSPDVDGNSTLHLWIDGSIIETFLDIRQVITTRFYDAPNEAGDIRLVWNGPVTSLRSLTVSEIRPISENRLTS